MSIFDCDPIPTRCEDRLIYRQLKVIVVPLLAGLSGAKISKITWIAAPTALRGVGILESNGAPFVVSLGGIPHKIVRQYKICEVALAKPSLAGTAFLCSCFMYTASAL